jgi:osmotically-inducible protein OsmY
MWQPKSDKDLERDVRDELAFDPRVDVKAIAVTAKAGVVTLSGSVPTYAAKIGAYHDVERVNGVRAVVEHMEVALPDAHARSDADLAKAVADSLLWHVDVPYGKIKTSVRDGWVTLEGTVDWAYQRSQGYTPLPHRNQRTQGSDRGLPLKTRKRDRCEATHQGSADPERGG